MVGGVFLMRAECFWRALPGPWVMYKKGVMEYSTKTNNAKRTKAALDQDHDTHRICHQTPCTVAPPSMSAFWFPRDILDPSVVWKAGRGSLPANGMVKTATDLPKGVDLPCFELTRDLIRKSVLKQI
jgi:hypothetical protein